MRIVTISDSPNIFSGLGRVHRHAIDALTEAGHEVVPLCWYGYDAVTRRKIQLRKTEPPPLFYKNVRLLDIPKSNSTKDIGPIFDCIKFIRPDVVLTIGDFWDFYYMHPIKIKTSFAFKWFGWFTIEHQDIYEQWKPIFPYIDKVACPSQFGVNAIKQFCGTEAVYIPYGAEKCFERLPEDERRKLRQERGCENKTRFITVAQNTSRKNLPSILLAASLILDKDIEFYIHTNLDDGTGGTTPTSFDLVRLCKQFGVQDKIKFPEEKDVHSVFNAPSDEKLAAEYNASDYFLMPSNCESFCLPMVEAMACGLPAVASCSSAMLEHLGGIEPGPAQRGYLAECAHEIWPPAMFMPKVIPECLAEGVEWLKGHGQQQIKSCQEYAKEKTWDKTKLKLRETIEELAGSSKVFVEVLETDKGTEQEPSKD